MQREEASSKRNFCSPYTNNVIHVVYARVDAASSLQRQHEDEGKYRKIKQYSTTYGFDFARGMNIVTTEDTNLHGICFYECDMSECSSHTMIYSHRSKHWGLECHKIGHWWRQCYVFAICRLLGADEDQPWSYNFRSERDCWVQWGNFKAVWPNYYGYHTRKKSCID